MYGFSGHLLASQHLAAKTIVLTTAQFSNLDSIKIPSIKEEINFVNP